MKYNIIQWPDSRTFIDLLESGVTGIFILEEESTLSHPAVCINSELVDHCIESVLSEQETENQDNIEEVPEENELR